MLKFHSFDLSFSRIFVGLMRVLRPLDLTRWYQYRQFTRTARITFVNRDGSKRVVLGEHGRSVLEIAHQNGIELEGACEGSMACSTCHVILQAETFAKLEEPCEREEDLLDLAPGLTDTSRLSCQIRVDERLDGCEITLPRVTVNFYVDGHIPKPH
jgi:ferredoxin